MSKFISTILQASLLDSINYLGKIDEKHFSLYINDDIIVKALSF